MKFLKLKKIYVGLMVILTLIAGVGVLYAMDHMDYFLRQRMAALLNLDTAPHSIHHVSCEDWGFSDVLVTCYFSVDKKDFPILLKGYSFGRTIGNKLSSHDHNISSGPKVGPEFTISSGYTVNPKPYQKNGYKLFAHGGTISLYTNDQNNQVILNFYEE